MRSPKDWTFVRRAAHGQHMTASPITRSKPGYLLAAAVLASAMAFIDSSVTAIALPSIRASLGGTLATSQWVQAGYLLVLTSLVLVGGAMSDRFGVVRVFQAGIAPPTSTSEVSTSR